MKLNKKKLNKKKLISVNLAELSPYDFECTLAELKVRIDNCVKEFGENSTVSWEPDRWLPHDESTSSCFFIKTQREETDAEFNTRIEKEALDKAQKDARELAEFQRLKAKFGEN